ncbi:HNH endonuclease [Streptomyces sp. NBC_01221]|uniref:HNH endonuclease signature motif containing protein n=1 Tax=Streptomyces sp. NBC_01221 TaxID=2903782 RepID=UPI0022550DCC|nr:HNH endonuclease signature motif containing protein [Streptomyces sp. NBC_01221]MCX4792557.1 HNH endonuclease [Streptomyces sp. NBC_01221]
MKGPCTEEGKQRIARTKTQAALQRWREQGGHPLKNRESRTAINWTLRDKSIPAKACSRCFTIKALTAYNHFASSADGLTSYCRECKAFAHANRSATDPKYVRKNREAAVSYYHANAPARREYSSGYRRRLRKANLAKNADRVQGPNALKTCAGQCGRTLPETSFRLDRGQNDGLRTKCRDCADSSRAARRACVEAYGNPIGQPCYLCMNVFASRAKVQADHLHPVSAGGPDEASNLWWAHEFCNIRRGARPLTPEEWDRARSLQRQAATTTASIVKEMTS